MFEWIDEKWGELLSTIIVSSAVGTLWRSLASPKDNPFEMARQAIVALTVGTVIGGAISQYFELSGFVAAGVISTAAYLGEHALEFFDKRGEKLRQGTIDISPKGDE